MAMLKKLLIGLFIVTISLNLSGCGVLKGLKNIFKFGERSEFSYGVTAQQWLAAIQEKAASWHPDAYLYGISEAEVNQDGSSDKWQYLFYSPGAAKTAVLVYEAGFVSIKETPLVPLDPIRNFRIDSPTALNTAKSYPQVAQFLGGNQPSATIMSLIGPTFETGRGKTAKWLIRIYTNNGAKNIVIDAFSGDVLAVK